MPVVSFHNLTVKVPANAGMKRFLPSACQGNLQKRTILHHVTGAFPSHGLVAVMGPSGSSKTTLLNAISNRMSFAGSTGMECFGEIRVNGKQVDADYFYSKDVSFVPQDTCLFAELTPRESIRFASQMNSPHLTEDEVEQQVESIITALNIQKCADTQIGNEMFRGISGGEAKRVAIGVNIVNSPEILFLDEPTTGLDSETAAMVVRSIQNISFQSTSSSSSSSSLTTETTAQPAAAKDRVIIMTLHQPSSEIWEMIDHIVLMAEGNIIYNGPTKDVVGYFASVGFHMPLNTNPADFFLDIVQCQEEQGDIGNGGAGSGANGSSLSSLSSSLPPSAAALLQNSSIQYTSTSHGNSTTTITATVHNSNSNRSSGSQSQRHQQKRQRGRGGQSALQTIADDSSLYADDYNSGYLQQQHGQQQQRHREVIAPRHKDKLERAKFLAGAWIHYQRQLYQQQLQDSQQDGTGLYNTSGGSYYNDILSSNDHDHHHQHQQHPHRKGKNHREFQLRHKAAAKRERLREMMRAYHAATAISQTEHGNLGNNGSASDGGGGGYHPDHMSHASYADDIFLTDSDSQLYIEQDYRTSGGGGAGHNNSQYGSSTATSSLSSRHHSHKELTPIQRFMYELRILTIRTWRTFIRTKLMLPLKIVQIVLSAILVICLYTPFTFNQTSALDRSGCVYLLIIIQIFATVLSVALVFPQERGVYLNEQASRLYQVLPYFVSKLVIDIPILTLTIIGFSLLVFFPLGFQLTVDRFIIFVIVLLGAALTGHGLGLTVAATIPTPELAVLLAPMAIAPFILFSHIALPTGYVLPILRPLQWLSPFWWGVDALMINEFTGLKMECLENEVYAVPSVVSGLLYICRFEFGEEVLEMYSIKQSMLWPSIIILYVIAGGTVIFSVAMLKFLSMRVANTVKMQPPIQRTSF